MNTNKVTWFKQSLIYNGIGPRWYSWFSSDLYLFHCLVHLFLSMLFCAGFNSGPNNRESVILCTRQEPWEGILLHLQRRHHEEMDVSWFSGTQGVCKYSVSFSKYTHFVETRVRIQWNMKTKSTLYNKSSSFNNIKVNQIYVLTKGVFLYWTQIYFKNIYFNHNFCVHTKIMY